MAGFKELLSRLQKARKDGNEHVEQQTLREMNALAEANPHQSQASVAIANITEEHYLLSRTYGMFPIAGKKRGEPYAVTVITGRSDVYDIGDNKKIPVPVSAGEIAKDLCLQINADAGESSFSGVFVCAGARPTEAELKDAEELLTQFYIGKVNEADEKHEIGQGAMIITNVHHRAARFLRLEKGWMKSAEQLPNCPACQGKIRAGTIRCPHCTAILDHEKWKKFAEPPVAMAAAATVETGGKK